MATQKKGHISFTKQVALFGLSPNVKTENKSIPGLPCPREEGHSPGPLSGRHRLCVVELWLAGGDDAHTARLRVAVHQAEGVALRGRGGKQVMMKQDSFQDAQGGNCCRLREVI